MKKSKLKLLAIGILSTVLISSCGMSENEKNLANAEVELDESQVVVEKIDSDSKKSKDIASSNMDKTWNFEYKKTREKIPYESPIYEVNANKYKFDLDSIDNKDEFIGFTENQKKMIEANGFVVIQPKERYNGFKIHHTYEEADYSDYPMFITSDVVLNMYHIFYSQSMMCLELDVYTPALKSFSQNLIEKSLKAYNEANGELKEDLKIVTAYYGVGGKLLGLDLEFPKEINELVNNEIKKITEAKNLSNCPLFNKDIDYTQYVVRGHYTQDENLTKYFKAMMWYGQSGFQISKEENETEIIDKDQLAQSLMATTLLMDGNGEDFQNWIKIYDLSDLYSGYSDDLNVLDFVELIKEVYGNAPELSMFKDDSYQEKLENLVLKMKNPMVQVELSEESEVNIPKGKQFRLMGQRYTLDADILQNLSVPSLRPIPTALDVLSAFGNEEAEELIDKYDISSSNWTGYDDKMNEMKEKVNNFTKSDWTSNLYNGWLWGIKAASTNFENNENMPLFMQNKAWSHKSIATALASYTELKHDNILYSKQSGAEMGGGFDERQIRNYVEPNVELYARLEWLIKYTKSNLENSITEKELENLSYMEDMLKLLKTVSIKELKGEKLTNMEFNGVSNIGGLIDNVDRVYKTKLRDLGIHGISIDNESTAIVADIATLFPNAYSDMQYLEQAVGLPYDIFVVCDINGKTCLTKGSVYTYYEFLSPKRLTDEVWRENLGLKVNSNDDFGSLEYEKTDLDILKIMPWMSSYISDESVNIETKLVEIDWNSYKSEEENAKDEN